MEISSWCFYLRIYVQIDWFLSKCPGYDFTHSSWPHWMKTFSAFLVLWRGIRRSPVDSLCIRSSDVPFDASHNKLFYQQSRGRLIDPSHKFYNALDKYLIMHHLVKNVTKWCIVGHGSGEFMDLCYRSNEIPCRINWYQHIAGAMPLCVVKILSFLGNIIV